MRIFKVGKVIRNILKIILECYVGVKKRNEREENVHN